MPREWDRWGDLVRAVTTHLRDRYGADEVATWEFEVWHEANLEVFWNGTHNDHHRPYETAAREIKAIVPRIRVGGPASAAAGWWMTCWRTAARTTCRSTPSPPTPTATHHSTSARCLGVRAGDRPRGTGDPVGVTPTHFHRVSDTAFAVSFVLRGMRSALTSTDAWRARTTSRNWAGHPGCRTAVSAC